MADRKIRTMIKKSQQKGLNVEVEVLNLNRSIVSGMLTKKRENQKADSLLG